MNISPRLHYFPSTGNLNAMVLDFFSTVFNWIMLLVILVNIQQRRYPLASAKRMATLLMAVFYMFVFILLILRAQFSLPEWMEWPILAIGIALLVIFRKYVFPFRRRCVKCGEKLNLDQWLGCDENLCTECFYEKHPELKPKEEKKKELLNDEEIQESFKDARFVNEVDWDLWEPNEKCVLTYVIDEKTDRILFIRKLRGLGEGLINGPGGHIEPEETSEEAAIRETKEETGLNVTDLERRGVLHFQFTDGLRMIGYVYFTTSFSGKLLEKTDETIPFWQDIGTIDWSAMWGDDRIWLPEAIKGRIFTGFFIFDGKTMLDSKVNYYDEEEDI